MEVSKMTEFKGSIVVAKKVYDQIRWFTFNYPKNEIGALGKVKLKNFDGQKCFYVYELIFPKQTVSSATVKIEGDAWSDLVREHGLKGLKDVGVLS